MLELSSSCWYQFQNSRYSVLSLSVRMDRIEERLVMFDNLNPENEPFKNKTWVWEDMLARYYEDQMNTGINVGKTQALQRTLLNVVQLRFPELMESIPGICILHSPDKLEMLIRQLITAPDAAMVRQLLKLP